MWVGLCFGLSISADEIGLRVSWGGGSARQWSGRIVISDGDILRWESIGSEVDEYASLVFRDGGIDIRPFSPRVFQGVDLVLDRREKTTLEIELALDGANSQRWTIPLSEVERQPRQIMLDGGSQLFIERLPGDELAVVIDRTHLIFTPGEAWKFHVVPRGLPYAAGTRLEIRVQIVPSRSRDREPRRLLIDSLTNLGRGETTVSPIFREEVTVGNQSAVPVEIVLPAEEGCYDIVITASPLPTFRLPDSVVKSLGWNGSAMERHVQVVVLDPTRRQRVGSPGELNLLGEAVDASSQNFWERLSRVTPHLPRLGFLGRGWRRVGGEGQEVVSELEATHGGEDPTWALYSLPVQVPGQPHVLEIEWPADRRQTLLFTLVEPNAMGAVVPPMVDFGVFSTGESRRWDQSLGWQIHRVVFWPRTNQPLLLVANPGGEPALYKKIRVYAGWHRLPELFPPSAFPSERLIAAYFHRPILTTAFGATDVPGPFQQQGLDDWVTFYQMATRLAEYVSFAGYNGVVLCVAADGSTIYPSTHWKPTPRYDSGNFSLTGADPIRKDVLELILRVADREGFVVIPAIDFSVPLPSLEEIIAKRGEQGHHLRWIGPDGRALTDVQPPYQGMAPYYNILQPEVQEELLAIVRELAGRYERHASFYGLAIQISAFGYAQLPGPEWGMDDETISRFTEETGIQLQVAGPNRYQERAQLLTGPYYREWMRWRSLRLHSFYSRVAQELAAVRPDSKLLLLTPTMFVGERWEQRLRPTLTARRDPLALFTETGLAPEFGTGDSAIELLRVKRMVEHADFGMRMAEFEIDQIYRAIPLNNQGQLSGALFYHPPQEIRLPSFDQRSPIQPAMTAIIHQPVPWGFENRRRYAQALADSDLTVVCDGGWRVPWGGEDSLRSWFAAFRRLPAGQFQEVHFQNSTGSLQPLVIRSLVREQETYCYCVNQAGFPVMLEMALQAPLGCRLIELSGFRSLPTVESDSNGQCQWKVILEPYELLAIKLTSPNVTFTSAKVTWSPQIEQNLKVQIADLSERAATLSIPPIYDVLENAGFEQPIGEGQSIPSWTVSSPPGTIIRLDSGEKHGGQQAIYLKSQGVVASIVSKPFPAPPTGRLTVAMWLKTTNPAVQPPIRCLIMGTYRGQPLIRLAEIGVSFSGRPVPAVSHDWTPILVEVADLPMSGLSPLQLRFDLVGNGELWMDDIQLCHLAFSKTERVELFKLIAPAQAKLENGDLADCLRLLDSFWAEYLVRYVPRSGINVTAGSQGQQRAEPNPSATTPNKPPDRSASLLDRVRKILPQAIRF
ncbi:MAG: family 10 glycosylhydrolase [Thermogutta sp.]